MCMVELNHRYESELAVKASCSANMLGRMQVLESAGKHQVLIFVHSRKETAKTARFLKEEALREDKLSLFMKARPSGRQPHATCSARKCNLAKCQVTQAGLKGQSFYTLNPLITRMPHWRICHKHAHMVKICPWQERRRMLRYETAPMTCAPRTAEMQCWLCLGIAHSSLAAL